MPEGGYTMDHGSGIFVVGPTGGIVAYLSAPHDAGVIARDIEAGIVWVKFVGTHAQYDRIDVETVNDH